MLFFFEQLIGKMLHEILTRSVSCVRFPQFQQKNHAYTLNSKYLIVYGCDSLILRYTRRTLGILFTFFLEKHDAWFNFGQPRAKSFIMYLPTYNLHQMSKIYFLDLLETLQNNLIKKMTKFCPKGLFWSCDIMQPAYKSYTIWSSHTFAAGWANIVMMTGYLACLSLSLSNPHSPQATHCLKNNEFWKCFYNAYHYWVMIVSVILWHCSKNN